MTSSFKVILSGTPSDSHSWNLIFMELFLKERGCQVVNLGNCVAQQTLYESIKTTLCDLVVISSINGHLFQDATDIMMQIPKSLKNNLPPFVVGGKLSTSLAGLSFQCSKLLKLGYQKVFIETEALNEFETYLKILQQSKNKHFLKYAV